MAAPAPVATTSQPRRSEGRPAPAKETVSDAWTFGGAVSLSRDIGGFGFVTTGLNASAVWNDQVSVEVQLERGTGRAENPSLSTGESVEESLLLGLIGLRYRQRIAGPAFAFLGVFVGSGRIATDEVADERSRIPASVQPLTGLRPLAGVCWQTGPVVASFGGLATFAQGHYFSSDEYGSQEGTKPPENSGLLSQGLQLQFGVGF